jgi:8-oxo-dGTP diphosphatase
MSDGPAGALGGAGGTIVERVRLAAYAWAEEDSAVLLVRNAPTERAAGLWTLPGGGLAFGEEPEAGAIREVREETGLDVRMGMLLGVRSAILEPEWLGRSERLQAIGILYRASVVGGELRHEVDESTDRAAWIPLAGLDELPCVPLVGWARGMAGS